MTFCLSFGDAFPVRAVRSSSRDSRCRGTSSRAAPCELPLMGFPKIAPLPFKACCVLSKLASRRRSALGVRLPGLTRGPSSSFLTTSTVCSASRPAGLLHPAAGCGVRHVSGSRLWPGSMQASLLAIDSTLPQWRPTLRSVPLDNSSSHVTATDSLSLFQLASVPFARRKRRAPVPSAGQPTSGLCSAAESVAARRRCRLRSARYSHGLRTIKVVHARASPTEWADPAPASSSRGSPRQGP